MKYKERIAKFLELQNKNLKFEDIALELGIAKTTLRAFLNKNGYKMYDGKYKLKDEISEFKQLEFEQNKDFTKNKYSKIKTNTKNYDKEIQVDNKKIKRKTIKRDKKINITQEDLDKLCEVYDWYMEVKNLKSMKSRVNKKDIKIEDTNLESLKNTTIKVDKKTWEDFERLCSNSKFTKQEIITQALKDFMKEYRNLL